MNPEYITYLTKAKREEADNIKFHSWPKRKHPNDLYIQFQQQHEQVFEQIDYKKSANCCKTISPIIYERDVDRLAKKLRIKPSQFIAKYLHIDNDKDYVLNTLPCPFLDNDNLCTVYEERPTACREYPHTNKKGMLQRTKLTQKNSLVCPAVSVMLSTIKIHYKV